VAESARDILLGVIEDYAPIGPGYLQTGPVMAEVARRLQGKVLGANSGQAVLTAWHDLFRSGLLAGVGTCRTPSPRGST
jgi:hypothetical protein